MQKSAELDTDLPSVEDQINAIGVGRFHHTLIVMVSFLCMADGMEMLVISLLSSALQTEWGVTTIEMGGLASAVFVGVLIGSLIGGLLGDKYGRRSTVLFGGSIFLVGAVSSALAPSLIYLYIFRSLVGFGFGIFLPASVCNFAEFIPTESRAFYQLFLTGIAWAMGEIIVCLVALAVHRYLEIEGWWRAVLLFCSIPGFIGFALAYTSLPESPHFLSVQGRHDEVEALIKRIAEENGRSDALLQGGRIRRIAEEPDADWSWFQLFSKDLLLLTLAVSALWSICSFAYYGMTFAYPLVLEQRYRMGFETQYWAVLLASAAEIPGIFLAIYCVGREDMGRRISMAAFFGVAAAVAAVVPLFGDAGPFLAANMALKMAVNGAFCLLFLFGVEIFPTTHRASGVALCSSVGRVAGICAPLALAYTLTASVALTYEVVAGVLVAGVVATLALPYDTDHKPLPSFAADALPHATARTPHPPSADPERRPLLSSSSAAAPRTVV